MNVYGLVVKAISFTVKCMRQEDKLKMIGDYKLKIEKELEEICGDILKIIDENLLPNSNANEPKVSDA